MRTEFDPTQGRLAMAPARPLSMALTAVVVTLIAWMSASCLLDLVIMPGLYVTGMMSEPGFVQAGDLIFSVFNRLELVAGALVLTGALLCQKALPPAISLPKITLIIAGLLMVIPLVYTYELTPQMSGLGIQLSLFDAAEVPASMDRLHLVYWGLEGLKVAACGWVMANLVRTMPQLSEFV